VRQTKNRQKGYKMLKKALTTTALATVLLTSSISANELATQGFSGSTAKVETIGAFDNIPTQGLSSHELNEKGESMILVYIIGTGATIWAGYEAYKTLKRLQNNRIKVLNRR
jgi:hypothetical protein